MSENNQRAAAGRQMSEHLDQDMENYDFTSQEPVQSATNTAAFTRTPSHHPFAFRNNMESYRPVPTNAAPAIDIVPGNTTEQDEDLTEFDKQLKNGITRLQNLVKDEITELQKKLKELQDQYRLMQNPMLRNRLEISIESTKAELVMKQTGLEASMTCLVSVSERRNWKHCAATNNLRYTRPEKQLPNCPNTCCERATGKGFERQEHYDEHLHRAHPTTPSRASLPTATNGVAPVANGTSIEETLRARFNAANALNQTVLHAECNTRAPNNDQPRINLYDAAAHRIDNHIRTVGKALIRLVFAILLAAIIFSTFTSLKELLLMYVHALNLEWMD